MQMSFCWSTNSLLYMAQANKFITNEFIVMTLIEDSVNLIFLY